MRCPYCGAEKELRVWTCAECNSPIPRPKKPAYEAAGWEWIPAIACLVLLWLSLIQPGEPSELVTFTVVFLAVAFAFSAARGEEGIPRVVAVVILALLLTCAACGGLFALVMGAWKGVAVCALWPGYCGVVLLVEDVRWRLKVARM
jgi:hypothetical protein